MASASETSEDDFEDDAIVNLVEGRDKSSKIQTQASGCGEQSVDSSSSPAVPIQKRRRVTRACDECRRKKIKCDGKQPCTHCTVYSYDCTYDQPSNRRRNPAPQYVEALEARLQRAESILRTVIPDINLDDPSWDASMPQHCKSSVKQEDIPGEPDQERPWFQQRVPQQDSNSERDSMLESMVENTGSLDLDDEGYWDFHGHSSGRAFLWKMREQFGDLMGKPETHNIHFVKGGSENSPDATAHSPTGSILPTVNDLPAKSCAMLLCRNALDDACAILRFVHQPTFYAMLDRIYDVPPDKLKTEDLKFVPLFYAVLALGTLFATAEQSELMTNGFENAIEQGCHWFKTSKSMIDVTDCRDLTSLQTILFMILFQQSSARLSTCYSYIGLALRFSLRMGLHRAVPNMFNPIEQETRKRIFWCVRKMDTYVGALLGLPKMLSDDDVDQDQPLEVDDEYITANEIKSMPPGRPSLISAFNAHTRILTILTKTVKYIYPIKSNKNSKSHSYIVSHAKIREIERDLQEWKESLPEPFRPGTEAPPEFVRIQHLLRMAYAHMEMFLYRPFLHYVSQDVQARTFDKRSYACAAACVSVSRNIIHLTGEMKRRKLLVGSYWFYMYTTFFAIISVLFYVLENPNSATSADVLKDAYEGKDTLAGLAARSLAADRCSKHLAELFEQLPEKLKGARMNIDSHKKRLASSQPEVMRNAPDVSMRTVSTDSMIQPANISPSHDGVRQAGSMTFPQLDPNIDLNYRQSPESVYQPASCGMRRPQIQGSASYLKTQIDHSVPDLSAMMFPSADPFAYPNQPMTTLENKRFVKQDNPTNQNVFDSTSTASYGNTDAQLTDGMPSYSMMPSQQEGGFMPQYLSMSDADPWSNALAMQQPDEVWSQQPQQTLKGMQRTAFDQLFGEDWGGWMSQGYA